MCLRPQDLLEMKIKDSLLKANLAFSICPQERTLILILMSETGFLFLSFFNVSNRTNNPRMHSDIFF